MIDKLADEALRSKKFLWQGELFFSHFNNNNNNNYYNNNNNFVIQGSKLREFGGHTLASRGKILVTKPKKFVTNILLVPVSSYVV